MDQIENVLEIFTMEYQGKPVITQQDEEGIWDYIHEFIKFGILFVHEQRCWGIKTDENGHSKECYTVTYEKDIKLKTLAAKFKVALDYTIDPDMDKLNITN